jgi:transcriptional regulator with XRE-family HTH domain
MNSIKQVIAQNLRKIMEYNGLNAAELGQLSGVAQRTVLNILDHENSEYTASVNTLHTLAEYFEIEIYYFFIRDMTPELMASDDFKELIDCYLQAPVGVQKKTLRTCKGKTKYFADRLPVPDKKL